MGSLQQSREARLTEERKYFIAMVRGVVVRA
jgi:hypothetical protein